MRFEGVVLVVALMAILAFAVFGCAAPTNSVIVQCIPIIKWEDADQDKLKEEYDALPPTDLLRKLYKDYIAMRDAAHASCPKQ